jgi:hypothetical protein
MKTLYITALICGLMISSAAYSITSINLPVQRMNIIAVDKVLVFQQNEIITDKLIADRHTKSVPNREDTIVIDLNEIVITEGFLQRSHACLTKQVKYPDFALEQKLEGVVAVTLLFNRDGNVEIVDSFGSDPSLELYVHEKLFGLHLSNCMVEMNKPYNARFTFRLF